MYITDMRSLTTETWEVLQKLMQNQAYLQI
jgi:hypothetical protein